MICITMVVMMKSRSHCRSRQSPHSCKDQVYIYLRVWRVFSVCHVSAYDHLIDLWVANFNLVSSPVAPFYTLLVG